MSNETKRDVFLTVADKCAGYDDKLYDDFISQYDAALPDDLPVIPQTVGEYIKRDGLLTEPLFLIFLTIQHNINTDNPPDFKAENWIIDHGDAFARAWLLSVWCIEETGGIVKLKADD